MEKNLYNILQIPENATDLEIKRAYRKLVLLYHPDKNPNISSEKIKEINFAYEILSNSDKHQKYDNMNNKQKKELYDILIKIFSSNNENFNNILNTFYTNKNEFINDINELKFDNIKNKVKSKLNNMSYYDMFNNFKNIFYEDTNVTDTLSDFETTIESSDEEYDDNDIIGNIEYTLKELYDNKLKKITVNRTIQENEKLIESKKTFLVPLINDKITINEEGDCINNNKGDIVLNFKMKKSKSFTRVNDNDLLIEKYISYYELIYGFELKISLPNKKIIQVSYKNPLFELQRENDHFIHIIKNLGLPKTNGPDSERGDILIEIKLNNMIDKKSYFYKLFPPINI